MKSNCRVSLLELLKLIFVIKLSGLKIKTISRLRLKIFICIRINHQIIERSPIQTIPLELLRIEKLQIPVTAGILDR